MIQYIIPILEVGRGEGGVVLECMTGMKNIIQYIIPIQGGGGNGQSGVYDRDDKT